MEEMQFFQSERVLMRQRRYQLAQIYDLRTGWKWNTVVRMDTDARLISREEAARLLPDGVPASELDAAQPSA